MVKFKELCEDGNLDGFQDATCYYLELEHGLMGFFPAIINAPEGEDKFIVCLDKSLLEKVRDILDKKRVRKSKIGEVAMLVHREKQLGFDKGLDNGGDLPILTQEIFDRLVADNGEPFKWAPGLLSLKD